MDLEGGSLGAGRGAVICETPGHPILNPGFRNLQEPLNAPFLNGLFSSGFSRRKTAP